MLRARRSEHVIDSINHSISHGNVFFASDQSPLCAHRRQPGMARIWIATANFERKLRRDVRQWKNVSALRLARLEFNQMGLRLPTWSACIVWSARARRTRRPWFSHLRQSQWLCLGLLGLVRLCLCRWDHHVLPRAPLGPCDSP